MQAWAILAFIATALIRPGRSDNRSASLTTGAARSAFFVNTPAVAQLVLLTSSATSGVPSVLRPACAAAAVKPRGDVMEPFGISGIAEAIGGEGGPRPSPGEPPRGSFSRTTLPRGPVAC